MRLIYGNIIGCLAGMVVLGVFFYNYINSNHFITKDRLVLADGSVAVSIDNTYPAENRPPIDVPLMDEDAVISDHEDGRQKEVVYATEPVSIGIYLDPDINPAAFDVIQLSRQENVGMSLDADGELVEQLKYELLSQRNIGKFLDVDYEPSDLIISGVSFQQNAGNLIDAESDFDSYLDSVGGSDKINIGVFIDPDDPFLFQ